jgi:hypothetical protein
MPGGRLNLGPGGGIADKYIEHSPVPYDGAGESFLRYPGAITGEYQSYKP